MRGTVVTRYGENWRRRITPADAGNSIGCPIEGHQPPDHPRGCGEQISRGQEPLLRIGSPPRMRGTAHDTPQICRVYGITPADAGNSLVHGRRGPLVKDHPRGCGEQMPSRRGRSSAPGSPPRMRGTAGHIMSTRGRHRITPADAGNS